MEFIVSMDWLYQRIDDPDVRIIDCRYSLADAQAGLESYIESHIPNALFFDVGKDLSGKVQQHGGRHPLPDIIELADKLSAAGIDEHVKVVAYDDHGGMFASRLWWLLKFLGHEHVAVLNGSFTQWKESNYRVESSISHFEPKQFIAKIQPNMVIEASEIKERLSDDNLILLDSREERRYRGLEEPIDKVAGHIPGAKHFFWKNNLDENGYWLDSKQLHEKSFHEEQELVVYCGSGITACPNVLALTRAGYINVKLYAGSWSDWISHPGYPVEKK